MMMFITFLLPLVLKKFPTKGVTTLFAIIKKTCPKYNLKPQMLTLQAIQGIQFVFNVSFFFFGIELGTKTHGFRYFEVFLGNAVKAYCDLVVNFRTSLVEEERFP